MTLSKLLGSRSRTLEARAPASSDSERIDSENFMKYVHEGVRREQEVKIGEDVYVEFLEEPLEQHL